MLTRRYGDFGAAEDAVQEALIAALDQWPRDGVPANPRGWLVQVASRRLVEQIRGDAARRAREERVLADRSATPPGTVSGDDTLVLLFLCCHPSLTTPSAIALTLRSVGGLTTAEIARAFLVPEATMAQRISRAKARIAASRLPFRLPEPAEREARLAAVLHVLYLIFNEGYTAGGVELQRRDLAREAIRLARLVTRLLPADGEAAGLLALMLLTDARRDARADAHGLPVPLAEQDRTRWDRASIDEGIALLTRTLPRNAPGPYQVQAAIAAVHDEAASAEATDWPQILALYDVLERMADNPVVTLNRAVATAMTHGPSAGLSLLATLDDRLPNNHRLAAARAHLHEMSGDTSAAIREYRRAADLTPSVPERLYLTARAAHLTP
ncbi:putative ECF RNA polymerase sigma factor SigI [Actinomadura rubteroloni]|uniref:Putative ECF RNA polymerase sigma factor SigI n=1 Tax=Actinomadura rubteroloni TaxID=1926885 RepID=A0A2P4UNF5_9ACTN|nr:putative ECF RNA polymerase sigma factor SigI [Actinomadura rubteroloni]